MKSINLLLAICFVIIGLGCSKKDMPEYPKNKIIGTWIEKYPELHDGVSDTITFSIYGFAKDHFYFRGWEYCVYNDTISFQRNDTIIKYMYSYAENNEKEIIIYNFLDRSITCVVKDIEFVKIR